MKTSLTETPYISKQRRNRVWLARLTLLMMLGLGFYYGYCWGLWGRKSLLLQYLFQCGCPAASAEARYPEEVDVIVPACRYVSSMLSPSGRFLYVQEKNGISNSTYLLDLQTNEKTPFFSPEGNNYFLTNDLLFLSLMYGQGYEGGEYLFDRNTGEQYPIGKFRYLRPDAYVNGDIDLRLLAEALRGAKYVFFINDSDTIVALTSGSRNELKPNFIAGRSDIPGFGAERVEQFLRDNNIAYQAIPPDFPDEVISPDKKFVARAEGIYLVDTNRKIAGGISWARVRGWTYDGSAVIYTSYPGGLCLIRFGFPFADDTACLLWVPQPVIMLNVPEEYLLPTQSPKLVI